MPIRAGVLFPFCSQNCSSLAYLAWTKRLPIHFAWLAAAACWDECVCSPRERLYHDSEEAAWLTQFSERSQQNLSILTALSKRLEPPWKPSTRLMSRVPSLSLKKPAARFV